MQSKIVGVRTEATAAMADYPLKYRLSHLLVRLVATVNIAHLLLLAYRPYFRAANNFLGWMDIKWMMASSFLLPLYVGFETWWMFRVEPSQKRALLIDWAFAVIWFVLWWGLALYSLYLYYPTL
jgi:hypothetical protein